MDAELDPGRERLSVIDGITAVAARSAHPETLLSRSAGGGPGTRQSGCCWMPMRSVQKVHSALVETGDPGGRARAGVSCACDAVTASVTLP